MEPIVEKPKKNFKQKIKMLDLFEKIPYVCIQKRRGTETAQIKTLLGDRAMTNTEKKNQQHRFAPDHRYEVKMFSEYTGNVEWYPLEQAVNLVQFFKYKTVCPDGEFDRSLFTAEKRLKKQYQ